MTMTQPLYLRLSITDQCNLRCVYCRPHGRQTEPVLQPLSRKRILSIIKSLHLFQPLSKVRITGGEPLLRPDVVEIVSDLRDLLPNATLALTTNGIRLAELAKPLHAAGLDAINVSIDSVCPQAFQRSTGSDRVGDVIHGIREAKTVGFSRLKTNAVLMKSVNGSDLAALVRLAIDVGAEPRFIELMPSGVGASLYPTEFLSADEAMKQIKRTFQFDRDLGMTGTSHRYQFVHAEKVFVVGFITPVSEPFCTACNRIRLDTAGRLHACLRSNRFVDLGAAQLESNEALERAVAEAIRSKTVPSQGWLTRNMVAIGG